MVVMMPVMMMVMNIVMVTIIWVGAHQVANSTMQVGDMMAFMQYAMQILFSLPDAFHDVHHPTARLRFR